MSEPGTSSQETPWCCTGRSGYVSECPLCPQYGTSLLEPCPGHLHTGENQHAIDMSRFHAERRHPDWEYATTRGPRKQWDDMDRPPTGEDCDPDYTWERNVDAGRPGEGWDRFDYTEESYWRRPKLRPTEPVDVDSAIADEGRPESPTETELNTALPVHPDPRQAAYDAVYEYIRALGDYLPPDPVHRNAVIWRAVHAALAATPVGRCISSHCVEGDHILIGPEEMR